MEKKKRQDSMLHLVNRNTQGRLSVPCLKSPVYTVIEKDALDFPPSLLKENFFFFAVIGCLEVRLHFFLFSRIKFF